MNKFQTVTPNRIKLLSKDALDQLRNDIEETKIFGIGEVHGVADNSDLYFSIFEEFNFECIALEYPVDCHTDLIKFLETGEYPTHWFFQEINDGRFSHEMLSMLKKLFESGKLKKVICFDKRKNTIIWNERDQDYADAFFDQYNKNLKTLIVAGGYHIRTEPFELEGEKGPVYPMCYHLKAKYGIFPTAKVIYTNGEFYNYGKKHFNGVDIPAEKGNLIKVEDYKYELVLKDVKAVLA